jgi:hypothetical protein
MSRIWVFLLFIFGALSASAQSACGIFVNRADFLAQKPTFEVNCDCRIKVPMNKDIVVYKSGEKVRFKYDFVYGYSDGKNLYRGFGSRSLFRDHGYYKVIYDSGVVIYSREIKDARTKEKKTLFFYSEDLNSQIMPLKRRYYTRSTGKALINIASIKKGTPSKFEEVLHVDLNDLI